MLKIFLFFVLIVSFPLVYAEESAKISDIRTAIQNANNQINNAKLEAAETGQPYQKTGDPNYHNPAPEGNMITLFQMSLYVYDARQAIQMNITDMFENIAIFANKANSFVKNVDYFLVQPAITNLNNFLFAPNPNSQYGDVPKALDYSFSSGKSEGLKANAWPEPITEKIDFSNPPSMQGAQNGEGVHGAPEFGEIAMMIMLVTMIPIALYTRKLNMRLTV